MKTVTKYLLLLLPLVPVLPVHAAEASVQELEAMLGEWQGGGWVQRGRERMTFTGHESVRYALDRTALLVEGRHFTEREGVQTRVHTALALIRAATQGDAPYSLHSYLSDGREIEGWASWTDGEFQWGFSVPERAREVRYRVWIDGDQWTEVGETRVENGEWKRYFEMHMTRVAETVSP
ncbi:MAG TPA: hypothetical protein VF254_07715 [Gammaproteobacteria bacterium]